MHKATENENGSVTEVVSIKSDDFLIAYNPINMKK